MKVVRHFSVNICGRCNYPNTYVFISLVRQLSVLSKKQNFISIAFAVFVQEIRMSDDVGNFLLTANFADRLFRNIFRPRFDIS